MASKFVVVCGEIVSVEFNYFPAEPPTPTSPGFPGSWEVLGGTWKTGSLKGEPISQDLLEMVAGDIFQQLTDHV